MKLGCLVVTVLCVTAASARAESPLVEGDPASLVRLGHQYRRAGDSRRALASFCSYLYTDASGELADDASQNARELATSLGIPAQSDHDACSAKLPAPRPATTASLDVPLPPPRITKREIAGLALIAGSITSLGFALLEAHTLAQVAKDTVVANTDEELAALAERRSDASLRQKLFLGAGGAAFLTGSILYVIGHADRKRAEKAYVAPTLTKGGGGLVFGGRF